MRSISRVRKLRGDHCQCPVCGEYFNSTAAFDKHRVGDWTDRRCMTTTEMLSIGMVVNAGGWWITAASPVSRFPVDSRSGDLAAPPAPVCPGEVSP